jgi:DNA-binding transcriptional LysR family regulator
MIDLRRLAVLRAIAHHGTVTAAADAVHLTPSAASQQVRQLSRDLGVSLMEPHGRRVRLTPAARILLSHADRMEGYWQEAKAELAAAKGARPRGTLRLAGFPTAVSVLLAPVAARLQKDYWPELTTEVREAEPRDCFDLLVSGEADLAVVEATADNPPLGDTRFEQHPLFDDPFDLLTTTGHRLAHQPAVTLPDLAEERWIVGFAGSSVRQLVLSACNNAGFTPTIAHQAREWRVIAALVAYQLGIALIPHTAELPPHLDLVRIPLTGRAKPCRRFLRVIRSGSGQHPAIAASISLLDAIALEHGRLIE